MVHVGVLKFLEEEGIEVEAVAGASIGAIVLGVYMVILLTLGVIMFVALVVRPEGITKGRELSWPFRRST